MSFMSIMWKEGNSKRGRALIKVDVKKKKIDDDDDEIIQEEIKIILI